jgi:Spy/CpxP family protein refolding chaperone
MKNKFFCAPATRLTAAIFFAFTCAAFMPGHSNAETTKGVEQPPPQHFQRISEKLNLTPEQQKTVQPILKADRESHKTIMEKFRPEIKKIRESIRNEMKAADKETDAKLAKILSPDQMAQYSKLRAERRSRMFAMRRRFHPLKHILSQLALTQQQQDAVRPIVEADKAKHKALWEKMRDKKPSEKYAMRSEMEAINKDTNAQLAKVLTADQMAQYGKLQDELKKSMHGCKARRCCRQGKGPIQ